MESIICQAEQDVTFERAMHAWYHKRSGELMANPNHFEFQARWDEHQKVFSAMLAIAIATLPKTRQLQIAEALLRSFGEEEA